MKRALACVVMGLVGCGGSTGDGALEPLDPSDDGRLLREPPPRVATPPARQPSVPAAAVAKPAALQVGEQPDRPDWLRTKTVEQRTAGSVETIAYGVRAAIVRAAPTGSSPRFYMVTDKGGVVGAVDAPTGTRWVGLGRNNRVLAAGLDGTLWASPSLADAVDKKSFVQISKLGAAGIDKALWDAGGTVVAAAIGRVLFISKDGGKTFKKRSLDRGTATKLFVRTDGVVVVAGDKAGEPAVWVSKKRGGALVPSKLTVHTLGRIGDWIMSDAKQCDAALSSDGIHWVKSDTFTLDYEGQYGRLVSTSPTLATATKPPEPRIPKMPRYRRKRELSDESMCVGDRSTGYPRGKGMAGILGMIGGCKGLSCVRAGTWEIFRLPPMSGGDWELLSDGLCTPKRGTSGECLKTTRLPHVIYAHDGRTDSLPRTCKKPQFIHNAMGLTLLTCSAGKALDVYARAGEGKWSKEITLDKPRQPVALRTDEGDSSVLITEACPASKSCRAWARRPLLPGAADAWRAIEVGRVVRYEITTGGMVVAITEATGSTETKPIAGIVLTAPGSKPRVIIEELKLSGPPRSMYVEKQRVIVNMRDNKGDHSFYVTSAGGLAPN